MYQFQHLHKLKFNNMKRCTEKFTENFQLCCVVEDYKYR